MEDYRAYVANLVRAWAKVYLTQALRRQPSQPELDRWIRSLLRAREIDLLGPVAAARLLGGRIRTERPTALVVLPAEIFGMAGFHGIPYSDSAPSGWGLPLTPPPGTPGGDQPNRVFRLQGGAWACLDADDWSAAYPDGVVAGNCSNPGVHAGKAVYVSWRWGSAATTNAPKYCDEATTFQGGWVSRSVWQGGRLLMEVPSGYCIGATVSNGYVFVVGASSGSGTFVWAQPVETHPDGVGLQLVEGSSPALVWSISSTDWVQQWRASPDGASMVCVGASGNSRFIARLSLSGAPSASGTQETKSNYVTFWLTETQTLSQVLTGTVFETLINDNVSIRTPCVTQATVNFTVCGASYTKCYNAKGAGLSQNFKTDTYRYTDRRYQYVPRESRDRVLVAADFDAQGQEVLAYVKMKGAADYRRRMQCGNLSHNLTPYKEITIDPPSVSYSTTRRQCNGIWYNDITSSVTWTQTTVNEIFSTAVASSYRTAIGTGESDVTWVLEVGGIDVLVLGEMIEEYNLRTNATAGPKVGAITIQSKAGIVDNQFQGDCPVCQQNTFKGYEWGSFQFLSQSSTGDPANGEAFFYDHFTSCTLEQEGETKMERIFRKLTWMDLTIGAFVYHERKGYFANATPPAVWTQQFNPFIDNTSMIMTAGGARITQDSAVLQEGGEEVERIDSELIDTPRALHYAFARGTGNGAFSRDTTVSYKEFFAPGKPYHDGSLNESGGAVRGDSQILAVRQPLLLADDGELRVVKLVGPEADPLALCGAAGDKQHVGGVGVI